MKFRPGSAENSKAAAAGRVQLKLQIISSDFRRTSELAAGVHEILAGIAPLDGIETIRFVFGVSDLKSKQWIPVKWL